MNAYVYLDKKKKKLAVSLRKALKSSARSPAHSYFCFLHWHINNPFSKWLIKYSLLNLSVKIKDHKLERRPKGDTWIAI